MGAFIDAADSHGWVLVHSVATDATPSGKVTEAAFDHIVVAGSRHQVLDPGFFTHAGIDPAR